MLGTVALDNNGVATYSTTALRLGNRQNYAYYLIAASFLNSGATIVQKVLAAHA